MNPKNIFYTLLVCLGLIESGKPDVKREKKRKKETQNKLSDDFTKTKMKLDHSFFKIPECQFWSKWGCLSEIIQWSWLMPNPLSAEDTENFVSSLL